MTMPYIGGNGVGSTRQVMIGGFPALRSTQMSSSRSSTGTGTGGRTAHRTCPLCEALCGLELTLDEAGTVTGVRGDRQDPLSKGFICPKGATLGRLDGDPDRLAAP